MLLLAAMLCLGQDYPHAFPREGTVKLFDNERITVWEVVWKKGVAQPYHRHRYDMAGVYLRYGPILVTRLDGTSTAPARYDPPRPYFQLKGVTHKEEASADPNAPEQLAIMIDLKDHDVPAFENRLKLEPAFPREGAADVLDNARIRMWSYQWTANRPVGKHVHDKDSVEVFYEPGTLHTTFDDGREETKAVAFKDARFIPRGRVDSESVVSGSPKAIVVELK